MSDIVEALVVGAGMFGAAAARHLSDAGAEVLVVGPAEPDPGAQADRHSFGAHFDEARITRRLGWDAVWGATDSRSLARFRDLEAASGIEFFHECGSLVVMAGSIAHRTGAMLDQAAAEGIEVERMSEAALGAEFPDLALPPMLGGVEGLLERRQAGYLNPRQLVRAQLALTTAAGGRLLRAAVTGLVKESATGLWRATAVTDGQSRDIRAERVLIATGAFTNQNNVLPPGRQLALHAFTEPNLLFEVGEDQIDRLRSLPAVVTVDPEDTGDENVSLYMLPPIRYPDGKWYMRIGPGMQPIVEHLDTVEAMEAWYAAQQITTRQEMFLTSMMHLLVPGLKPVSTRAAGCIIEKTPSRYPYIGHLDEDESLTVAVGGNGHGARGSDEIGRLAADVVAGRAWDFPIPQETFTPLAASAAPAYAAGQDRPEYLKPPFGLC